jgi:hypothetical protein
MRVKRCSIALSLLLSFFTAVKCSAEPGGTTGSPTGSSESGTAGGSASSTAGGSTTGNESESKVKSQVGTGSAVTKSKPAISKVASYSGSDNWYPSSIALPAGLSYPCALRPLPSNLAGIPAADRRYINHAYALILQCVQAKTIMVSKLTKGSARNGYSTYYNTTRYALEKLRAEPTPKGLESFRNQVMNAILLQVKFFDKASLAAEANTPFNQLMQIPEGRQASSLLINAFGQMSARYPQWSAETKDSIYHHLCALDLF